LSTAIALLALTVSGRGQAPQGAVPPGQFRMGTGLIGGVVVDGAGQPVPDALVTLGGRGGPPERVIVDARGRFVFRQLPAGAFGVIAARPGYLGGALDQQDPTSAGRPIELTDGQQVTNVTLRLWSAGAIGGTVRGDAAEPLAGVEVHALRRTLVGGRWMISPAVVTSADDRGQYRFDSLVPGDYIIAARPDRDPETALLLAMLTATPAVAADVMAGLSTSGQTRPELDKRIQSYPLTFHPDAIGFGAATSIGLAAGSERANVDVRLKRGPAAKVSGTLSEAADGITLQLVAVDAIGATAPVESAVTACDESGAFEFTDVTAGRYLIKVQSTPPTAPGQPPPGGGQPPPPGQPLPDGAAWSGSVAITVGTADLTKISVPVKRGVPVTGRLVFNGNAALPMPAQLGQITLRLDPVDQPAPAGAAIWRGVVSGDGQFRTMNVPPGEYLLRLGAPPRGWTLQSAMSGGRDILDVPVVVGSTPIADVTIAFSDAPLGATTGFVRDATGVAVSDSTIVVFPADRTMWRDSTAQARRVRATRPTTAGRFGVQGLPAGEYLIAAVAGELPSEWQDAERLAALSAVASRVQLAPGPAQPIDLTVKTSPTVKPMTQASPGLKSRPSSATKSRPAAPPARTTSTTPADGAIVTGTVVDQVTQRPVSQATVLIAGTDIGVVRVTVTDTRGQYGFAGVPAGHFLIGAGKAPYLATVHGASRPGRPGTIVTVSRNQRLSGLSIALVPGAVIAGRVVDDRDRPVPGARVRVVQHRAAAGEVAMNGEAGDPVTVTTDDRGAYRVFNLPPGEYAVLLQARGIVAGDVRRLTDADFDNSMAAPTAPPAQPNGLAMGWSPAYAPGTANPSDAIAVTVAAGEERANVNVRTSLARFVRVEGTVSGPDAPNAGNVQVTLRPRGMNASGAIVTNLQIRPGPDGRFMFPNVPPGDYTVMARTLPPPQPQQLDRPLAAAGQPNSGAGTVRWAMRDVTVREESVADLNLELRAGFQISGELRVAGVTRLPADLPLIRVGLRPTPGSFIQNLPENVLVGRDGRFTIQGVVPGKYRLFLQIPNNDVLQVPAWFAKTALVDGVNLGDALDVPITLDGENSAPIVFITITGDTQEIDGVVRDASGALVRDCTVLVFPTDRQFWFQQSRRVAARQSGRDGRFVFGIAAALPTGEYYVAAVPDGRPGEQLDVLLLEELAKTATRVTLNADETKTVELRVSSRERPRGPGEMRD